MGDYKEEFDKRVAFIKDVMAEAHATGIVFGNSGGKDSALVGILCKAACEDTVGLIMPCNSKRNFTSDREDGMKIAEQFQIETRLIDLTEQRAAMIKGLESITSLNDMATTNLAPRLRMVTLYAVAASENRVVAGTSNQSERYMGYFTKWGDAACDFNPISDLTASEVLEFLTFLKAPVSIIEKAPSAGLFEGQTDEEDMGVTYQAIDTYMETGKGSPEDIAIIERYHYRSEHKRYGTRFYVEL